VPRSIEQVARLLARSHSNFGSTFGPHSTNPYRLGTSPWPKPPFSWLSHWTFGIESSRTFPKLDYTAIKILE